jgi:soluble lytic murein transglycosylase
MAWIVKWKWWLFALIAAGGLLALFERWRSWGEDSHDTHILAASRKYGVEPALIKAVIWRESRFDPRVQGRVGEVGLMQLREAAASDWAKAEKTIFFHHHQLFDPAKNIQAGTWYLKKLLSRYTNADNPIPYALADYNAGRTHVLRWNKGAASTNSAIFLSQIDFPTTRKYVVEVMARREHYKSRDKANLMARGAL